MRNIALGLHDGVKARTEQHPQASESATEQPWPSASNACNQQSACDSRRLLTANGQSIRSNLLERCRYLARLPLPRGQEESTGDGLTQNPLPTIDFKIAVSDRRIRTVPYPASATTKRHSPRRIESTRSRHPQGRSSIGRLDQVRCTYTIRPKIEPTRSPVSQPSPSAGLEVRTRDLHRDKKKRCSNSVFMW